MAWWGSTLGIFTALATLVDSTVRIIGWRHRKLNQPKLELAYRIDQGVEGVQSAAKISLLIRNSGRSAAEGVLVELRIFKPRRLSVGDRLFFNTDISCVESSPDPMALVSFAEELNGQEFAYRLKPHIIVNAGIHSSLQIAHFIVCAFENYPLGDLAHELKWKISKAGIPSTIGTMKIDGSNLKRMLMINLNESGQDDIEKFYEKLPKRRRN
jgi:hypothetical protein